jgi:hypothetical protein
LYLSASGIPWTQEQIIERELYVMVKDGETVPDMDFMVSRSGRRGVEEETVLQGRILDPGGNPAEGVEIDWIPSYKRGGTVRSARSGKDGRFTIPLIDSRDIMIRALDRNNKLKGIVNLSEKDGNSLEIVLAPCRMTSATGRVIDAEGNPVSGVTIMLGDTFIRRSHSVTITNDTGTYIIPGLIIGDEYNVSVLKRGDIMSRSDSNPLRPLGFTAEENMPPLNDIVVTAAAPKNAEFR